MNPLQKEIDEFLGKIALYESISIQTKTHLLKRKEEIKKQIESSSGIAPFIGTTLIIGDITGPSENGWKLTYPTGFNIHITKEKMAKSLDKLIIQNGMTCLATCYEILESFLFNILGEYLNNFPDNSKYLKDKKENLKDNKLFLRKYYRSKNNKELFKLLRQISPEFVKSEKNNNTGMNLQDWYFVISNVRHSIVHSQYLLNIIELNFNKNHRTIFDNYFSHTKTQKIVKLNMSFDESKKQINMIGEFGFMIFKTLSKLENKNWKILKNMQK